MVGALHGVRILDLSTNVSGPFATGILGDMGLSRVMARAPVASTAHPATGGAYR